MDLSIAGVNQLAVGTSMAGITTGSTKRYQRRMVGDLMVIKPGVMTGVTVATTVIGSGAAVRYRRGPTVGGRESYQSAVGLMTG